MPRENKKRGRRAEAKKRKAEDYAGDDDASPKRQRLEEEVQPDVIPLGAEDDEATSIMPAAGQEPGIGNADMPFYGLLDEQEQEYFRRADDMLETNQFSDAEERILFLENVYKEVEGKELKMACSQSSSRLLERLILLSTPAQLKKLFQKLSGHFLNLAQHRFASHCCETLFKQAAPIVTQETADPSLADSAMGSDEPVVTMENLFLFAITELEGNLGFLMTDRFGAHTLRVLLLVLSGQPFEESTQKALVSSKRKEKIDVAQQVDIEKDSQPRVVPEAFTTALEKMISDAVGGLETPFLRSLATHPIGNPTLQLLIRLELTQFGKQRAKEQTSIVKKLLPDDPLAEGTESAAFINNLVYDQVGSRLLETIIEHAPGKLFKTLYKEFFRDRMGSLARNEVAGYVVAKIVERLSSDDLAKAIDLILPQIPSLAERGRTSLVRTLVERCAARGVDTQRLADTIHNCWADDEKPTDLSLAKMLLLDPKTANSPLPPSTSSLPQSLIPDLAPPTPPSPATTALNSATTLTLPTTPASLHTSLLAQSMLSHPGPLSTLLQTAISNLSDALCLRLAYTPTLSPILQTSLTSMPSAPLIFRRKLIKRFYSHICALSLSSAGSRLVDAIWAGTAGLAFARERIAEELAESEQSLRESRYGRAVWRNWKMDVYKRRRGEWVRSVRGEVGNDGFLSFPGTDGSGDEGSRRFGRASEGRRVRSESVGNGSGKKDLLPSEAGAVKRNGGAAAEKVRQQEAYEESGGLPGGVPKLKQPTPPRRGRQQQQQEQGGAGGKSKLDQARERYVRNKERKDRETESARQVRKIKERKGAI